MSENLPDVSIIVPVYNGQSTLQRCLNSLANLDYPKEKLEIIVVDNNSTDNTPTIIKQYPVDYVFEEKRSRPRARNKGIGVSRGEIICFLDADCSAHPDWVRNLIRGFDQENIGAYGGKIVAYQSNTWVEKYLNYSGSNFRNILKETPFAGPYIDTANSAYRRKIFEEIGLFDESLLYNEDVDLSWRVCLNGYRLGYVPEAVVYRKHESSLSKFVLRFFHCGCDTVKVTKKYGRLTSAHFSNKPLFAVFYEPCQFVRKPLVNLFTKKYRWQKIFSLLEIVQVVSLFLGSGYWWLEMRLKRPGTQLPLLTTKDKTICWGGGTEMKLLDFESASYYNLNETGGKIWEMLKAEKNIEEIIDAVSQEYQVSRDNIRTDVLEFIDTVKKQFKDQL